MSNYARGIFQPATVLCVEGANGETEVRVGAATVATLTRDDFPSLQEIIQNISQLSPGQPFSDALRTLRPSAQGCARCIVGPIQATVQETCPQVVQVPSVETYQTAVQRLRFQPVVEQVPVLAQRPVLRNVLQQSTVQYSQQM